MRKLYFFLSCFFISFFFLINGLHATHIRAGEITTVRISPLTYQITITGYRDRTGVQWGNGILSFGHDNEMLQLAIQDWTKVNLDEGTEINTYVTTHTFPSTGPYTIQYFEANRNPNVLNVNNGASDQITFYIETQIVVDPSVGLNASPVLTVPPIDKGAVGLIYLHNPGAFDREGDSLSYKLVPSKDKEDSPVPNFVLPNDPMFGGSRQNSNEPPIFTLNPYTGDVVWDAPAKAGEYNFAFIIEEWRKIDGQPFRLGYVTRDMQVIIEETDNLPPELTIPNDTCITAGTTLREFVLAMDPDGHDVKIEAYGGLFSLNAGNVATFDPNGEYLPSPAAGEFVWKTSCENVREKPYEVIFKATDNPPVPAPPLIDMKTWRITVVAPAPEGLTAEVKPGREVLLNWDDYGASCSGASIMQIWRKVGSYNFVPDNCETGIPEGVGYELIAETDIGVTSYLDDNGGSGLPAGADYCYRLVAVFPQPKGGESYASEEVCVQMAIDVPLITNVDITATDMTAGEIDIRWTSPLEIDKTLFPPPYYYKLFRAEGFSGSTNLVEVPLNSAFDTVATDINLNTLDKAYNYRVVLYSGGLDETDIVDTSAVASSVRLIPTPRVGAIELNWQADVPWSINAQGFPLHDIYRNRVDPNDPDAFKLIASVNVNDQGLFYLDNGNGEGLSDKLEYCYYVVTRGTYGHPLLADIDPLINRSQKICAQPNDTIPPCAPTLTLETVDCEAFLENKSCDFNTFSNTLHWANNEADSCDNDIKEYEIYFSETGTDGSFKLLTTVTGTSFVHNDLPSFAGCYFIRAVDRSNNKSVLSETVCNDNCPYYELPNVFTPNGDGLNDVFQAFNPDDPAKYDQCPRFVESVKVRFYNRWGKEIYNYESSGENTILIKWDGRSFSGQRVPTGIYYYLAEVRFDVLNPAEAVREIKGWVHVMY